MNERDTQNIIRAAIILTLQHLHNPLEKPGTIILVHTVSYKRYG